MSVPSPGGVIYLAQSVDASCSSRVIIRFVARMWILTISFPCKVCEVLPTVPMKCDAHTLFKGE